LFVETVNFASGLGLNQNLEVTTEMATTVEDLNAMMLQIGDYIGDLQEKDVVLESDITALETSLGNLINDTAASGADVTYSVNKILSLVDGLRSEIKGGAVAPYDSLNSIGGEIDTLKGRVSALETDVAALQDKFGVDGKIKAAFIPDFVTDGLQFEGMFDPTTDTLPAASIDNDGHFYKIHNNSATVTLATGDTLLNPGDTVISDGSGWYVMNRTDTVLSVNGQTGEVVLTAGDIGFTASVASGLSSADVAAALNELAESYKATKDKLGDLDTLTNLAALKARVAAAASDGVTTAAA
jgi:hypothetical protein